MVLLNLDAGEHDDEPEELWALADVLSIACGGHAGDDRSMERVVAFCGSQQARGRRPRIGAHPSYPDRDGFGRRTIAIEHAALVASIAEQCAALAKVAAAHGQRVEYVKPHGALYHDAAKDALVASAVIAGALDALGNDFAVIGPAASCKLFDAAKQHGLVTLVEGFADRATRPDGSLVPRSEPGALITNPPQAAARARQLVAHVDTICVHADTPGSLAIASAVREAIDG